MEQVNSDKMSEMTTIKFDQVVPEKMRPEIEALFEPFLFLVPQMRTLQVSLKGSESGIDGEAAIQVLRRYHTAHIWLDPSFFALDVEDQELTVLHELFHIVTNVYTREVHRIVDHMRDDFQEFIADSLEDAEETLVDVLAWKFYRLWKGVKDEG